MCSSFHFIHVKAVLGYFRSLPLPKKQAVAGILPNQATHSKVLLREDRLPLCFLIHVWMPGIERQNKMTQELVTMRVGQTATLSSSSSSYPWLSPPCAVPMGLWHIWLMDAKSNGAFGLSLPAKLSGDTMKPQTKSEIFRSQMSNAKVEAKKGKHKIFCCLPQQQGRAIFSL